MPRAPPGQISGNITKRKELSPYKHGLIIGKHESRINLTQISQNLQIPRSTIIDTL